MSESTSLWTELLAHDKRYRPEAYLFVFESLEFAQRVLGMGQSPGDDDDEPADEPDEPSERPERHLTGQELCDAARVYALDQYGYLAKSVLNSWGIYTTGDIGEIVYNLIRIGRMKKTPSDRREDFDDVFDFETELRKNFSIELPD